MNNRDARYRFLLDSARDTVRTEAPRTIRSGTQEYIGVASGLLSTAITEDEEDEDGIPEPEDETDNIWPVR